MGEYKYRAFLFFLLILYIYLSFYLFRLQVLNILYFSNILRFRSSMTYGMNSNVIKVFYILQFASLGLEIVITLTFLSIVCYLIALGPADITEFNNYIKDLPFLIWVFRLFTYIPQTISHILLLILFWQLTIAFYVGHLEFAVDFFQISTSIYIYIYIYIVIRSEDELCIGL